MLTSTRWLPALLGAALAVIAPAPASAGLGEPGSINIGIERLFGFTQTHVTDQIADSSYGTYTRTDLGLFIASAASVYSTPRLAVDVGIVNGITVGGSFGVLLGSSSRDSPVVAGYTVGTSSEGFGFVAAPRGGFALGLGDKGRLWLRGGFTYFHVTREGTAKVTFSGLSLNAEPTFAFLLNDAVALTAGLVFDLPLTGETKTEQTLPSRTFTKETTVRNVGLVLGLTLVF